MLTCSAMRAAMQKASRPWRPVPIANTGRDLLPKLGPGIPRTVRGSPVANLSKALWGEARGPGMQDAAQGGPHAHLLCGVGPVTDMSKALRGQGVLILGSLLSSLSFRRR